MTKIPIMVHDSPHVIKGLAYEYESATANDFPMANGTLVFVMGEIEQQPGHLIVVEVVSRKWHFGLHADRFRQPTEDEI